MATNSLDVGLRLSLNQATLSQARAGLRSISEALTELRSRAATAIGALAGFEGIKALAELADQYRQINARLQTVSSDTREYVAAQKALFDVAQETGTPLANIVDIYTRMAPALKEMGRSQADNVQLTKTLADALELSGTSAEDASGFIDAFTKSLALNRIDQRALSQMAERAPALMQALARALHVPISALDDLAKNGELTRDRMVAALLQASEEIGKKAEALAPRFDQAMVRIRNSFQRAVGEIDESMGVSSKAVAILNGVAAHMTEILKAAAVAVEVLGVAFLARLIPALLTAGATYVTNILLARSLAAELGITAGAATTAAAAFSTLSGALSALFALGAAAFAGWKLGEWLRENFQLARDAGYEWVSALLQAFAYLKAGFQSIGPVIILAWQGMLDTMRSAFAEFYDFAARQFDKLPGKFAATMAASMRGAAADWRASIGKGVGDQAGAELDRIKNQLAADIAEIKASFATLAASPMDDGSPAPSGKGKPPPPPPDIRSDELFKAALARAEEELKASLDRRQITEEQYLQAKLDLDLMEVDKEIADTEKKRAKAYGTERTILDEHLQQLRAKRLEIEQKTLDEIGDKDLKAAELLVKKIQDELEQKRVRIQIDIQAGRLTGPQGAAELTKAENDARDQLRKVFDQLVADPRFKENPAALTFIKTLGDEIVKLGEKSNETFDRIARTIDGALADSIEGLINGTKSAKNAFADLGNSVVKVLERIAAEMLAVEAINAVVGFFSPGATYTNGKITFPTRKAGGGYVSGPGGPTEDRVPALLSSGEYVIQASSVRRFGLAFLDALNGGGLPSTGSRLAFGTGGLVPAVSHAKPASVEINMINQVAGAEVAAERRRGADGREVVDVIVREVARDIQSGGRVWQSLENAAGLQRRGRRA